MNFTPARHKHKKIKPADIEKFENHTTDFSSFDYPLQTNMRWDKIPSGNNEDLFRGILHDYSAITGDFEDNIGQQLYFGVANTLDVEDGIYKLFTTAAVRGVYRTSKYHEAQLVVGTPTSLNERDVKIVVNASAKQVDINVPMRLHNIYNDDNMDHSVEAGTLASYIEVNSVRAKLLFFDGLQWKEVELRDLDYEV
jgi:hypothetical protein